MSIGILPQRVFTQGHPFILLLFCSCLVHTRHWARLWGKAVSKVDPKELTVCWRRQMPPSHHSYITYVSTDHITAAKEKHRVFRWVIRATQFRLRVQ